MTFTPPRIWGIAFRAMVLIGGYTGCRFGEIAAFDLDHYDPDRRLIRTERSLGKVRDHLRFSEPKTPAARRAITIRRGSPVIAGCCVVAT